MDPSTNLKIELGRMGAELRRVKREVDRGDEKLKMALSVCMSLVDYVDTGKKQVERVWESWKCLEGKVKDMEESVNDEVNFDEMVEGREFNRRWGLAGKKRGIELLSKGRKIIWTNRTLLVVCMYGQIFYQMWCVLYFSLKYLSMGF